MLVRITWALVVAALGTLIGGFFTPDSNVLLFVAIGLALCVIVLVLVSWARRAREATGYGFEERVSAAGRRRVEATDEELFATLEEDEEFAVGGRSRARRPRRGPARAGAASRPRSAPKAKAKPKSGAKAKPKAARKSTASDRAKPKAARKGKPKATRKATRPKARQPRPRPPEETPPE
ncbi:MAG: hypothetical protein ACRDKJ_04895 [Actinomycetota bacterium]